VSPPPARNGRICTRRRVLRRMFPRRLMLRAAAGPGGVVYSHVRRFRGCRCRALAGAALGRRPESAGFAGAGAAEVPGGDPSQRTHGRARGGT